MQIELDFTGKLSKVHISELSHCKSKEAGIFIDPFPLVMDFNELLGRDIDCPVLPACWTHEQGSLLEKVLRHREADIGSHNSSGHSEP